MAKVKTLFNVSPGLLILPNGVEIQPGEGIKVPEDYAENAGVRSWITDGLASEKQPEKVLIADLATITDERDALAAKVAELQAQLDAAAADKGK